MNFIRKQKYSSNKSLTKLVIELRLNNNSFCVFHDLMINQVKKKNFLYRVCTIPKETYWILYLKEYIYILKQHHQEIRYNYVRLSVCCTHVFLWQHSVNYSDSDGSDRYIWNSCHTNCREIFIIHQDITTKFIRSNLLYI